MDRVSHVVRRYPEFLHLFPDPIDAIAQGLHSDGRQEDTAICHSDIKIFDPRELFDNVPWQSKLIFCGELGKHSLPHLIKDTLHSDIRQEKTGRKNRQERRFRY